MKPIDLSKYGSRIEASRRRRAATFAFEEGDRVTTNVSAGGSYFCYLFGVDIGDYYQDIDLQIETQAKGMRWWLEHCPDDRTHFGLGLDLGPVGEALASDLPIQRPKGTSPWIVRCIEDAADVERLTWPPPKDDPRVQVALGLGEEFRQRAEGLDLGLPVGGVGIGIHPPLSCACALAEPAWVYEMMLTEPRVTEALFGKCYQAFCDIRDYLDGINGTRTQYLGLADDNCSFVSPELYNDQVLPWNQRLYARYGPKGRSLHADGPHHQHFATYANVSRLNHVDIGGWSRLQPAVDVLKPARCVVNGNLNCRDFYGALDETLRRKIRQTIRLAAPGGGYVFAIGGETYAGVNPDALIRGFEYAHEVGAYPIDIDEEPMPDDDARPWA